ncbi:MAG: hypothetical protein KY476_16765 [Planctomycetes bacterium]|nr:hypothetical protein [Planctomycetota bacterium]
MLGRRSIVACLCLLAGVLPALAQEPQERKRIVVQVEPLAYRPRHGGPIVFDWHLRWTGKGVLEGRLVFDVLDVGDLATRPLGTFETRPLALTSIEQSVQQVLPTYDVTNSYEQITLQPRFITEDKYIPLPEQTVFVPPDDRRTMVTAICNAWGRLTSAAVSELERDLRPDRFDPQQGRSQAGISPVAVWLDADRLSARPLEYCAFDLVLLCDEGFAALRAVQLEAIAAWVEAGGSVYVRPGDETLDDHHASFLNSLAGASRIEPRFRLDASGRLQSFEAAKGLLLFRRGVGRAVISAGNDRTNTDRNTPAFREASWFLWKLRRDVYDGVVHRNRWQKQAVPDAFIEDPAAPAGEAPDLLREDGAAVPPLTKGGPGGVEQPDEVDQGRRPADALVDFRPDDFGVQPIQSGNWLLERLIPESVQMVPLWIVGLVLGVYVLVVGPVDYFALGLVRGRRLTWVLFPLVTLFFAWFTVWLSNRYMRTTEMSRSLIVLDVGDDGRIVRSNRLRLWFTNTSATVEETIADAMLVPMEHRRFGTASRLYDPELIRSRGRGEPIDSDAWSNGFEEETIEQGTMRSLVAPPFYSGSLPGRYTFSQRVPQWTPHLERTFEIAPEGFETTFPWDSTEMPPFLDAARREALMVSVRGHFGEGAAVALITQGGAIWHVGGDVELLDAARNGTTYPASKSLQSGQPGTLTSDFLLDLSARPTKVIRAGEWYQESAGAYGLFSLVSQISPTGGDTFEDLAILDTSDPRQRLLLVAVPRGRDILLYRKLYLDERNR